MGQEFGNEPGGIRDSTSYCHGALIAIQSIDMTPNMVLKCKNNTTSCDFGYLGFLYQFVAALGWRVGSAQKRMPDFFEAQALNSTSHPRSPDG
jgi:hypothetical protein